MIRLALLTILLAGCGTYYTDICRTGKCSSPDTTRWHTVDTATIVVELQTAGPLVFSLSETINYSAAVTSNVRADTSELITSPVEDEDAQLLSLGSYGLNRIRDNKLNDCGPGGNERCTEARIVMRTDAGFVHTTEGYTLPLSSGTTVISTTDTELTTYTIPSSDRRLTQHDFGQIMFPLVVDMSNAGYGDYTVTITIEVQTGN